jgi:aldehyde dehydrogenase (NAD+)
MSYATIFQSQQAFFATQATKPLAFRKAQLQKFSKLLKQFEAEMYNAIYTDFRKSVFDTYTAEIGLIETTIKYYLKNIDKLAKPQKVSTNIVNIPGSSYVHAEPVGTTLIIGAWNYPYQLTLVPVITAIAAGNTCIIKPSELPENTMKVMAKMINENFDPSFLYVVEGGVPETTEVLALPFDKIFFTGSTRVGKIVYEAAAKNLTPVVLELGGKSPAIVTKHANIAVAAKRIVWGKFLNAGQTCVATDYILVESSVKEALAKEIIAQLKTINYADGAEHYVSIINERNFDRVTALIDPAKVIYGGSTNRANLYIEPTVMDQVTWTDAVMQEEVFGPVLPILSFDTLDNAFQQVLAQDKPLAAYFFSDNANEQTLFVNTLSFGGGCINETVMQLVNEHLPFGGVGASGMGHYHGPFGFMAFSHQKAILKKANWGETPLKYPPYSQTKKTWIERLLSFTV